MVAERVFEVNLPTSTSAGYPEILNEQIIYQHGNFKRVRQYLKGWHPELGKLHMGWQGRETVVEKDAITPAITFTVAEPARPYTGLKQLTRHPHLYVVTVYQQGRLLARSGN